MKRSLLSPFRIFLFVVAVATLWLAYKAFLEPSARDLIWRHDMLAALDSAATVKVVEHPTAQEQAIYGPLPKIYATVTLNAEQIVKLRSILAQVRDKTRPGWILKCTFDDHHYIEMIASDGSTRTLLLCFECGQFYLGNKPEDRWYYGDLGIMSDSWKSSMSDFILSLGLHPDGPWRGPDAVWQKKAPGASN